MSALEQRERFSIVCHGPTNNYWATNNEEEAHQVYDTMSQYINKPYRKVEICEWKAGHYVTINEVTALPFGKRRR